MERLLRYLAELNQQIGGNTDVDRILKDLLFQAVHMCRAEYGILSLYDKFSEELYYHVYCQFSHRSEDCTMEKASFHRMHLGEGIVGWCASNKTPVNVPDATTDRRYQDEIDNRIGIEMRSLVAVPLVFNEELLGVITIMNKKNGGVFTTADEKRLSALALHAALFIANSRLMQEKMSQDRLSDIGQSIVNSAHGLKNLLNNMDGGTYIVEMGASKKDMDAVYEGWDIITRNSQRLRELVVDMLLYSRPRRPEYAPTDIRQLCTELIELVKEKARSHNVELRLQSDPDIGLIDIDAKGIHRAILNVVSNAMYACRMKNGGKVEIRLRKKAEDLLEIMISDDGTGISQENLSHIFEVFFTTKGSKGTGLGLPVTQKIITEHNGKLSVESEVNEGTTFTITLPTTYSGSPVNSGTVAGHAPISS